MKIRSKLGSCLVLALGVVGGAHAELDDPPYFNLWLGTSGNKTDGDGTLIQLCGTSTCNGNTALASAGGDAGYAIFKTALTNTGKGSGAIDPFLRFHHNEGDALGSATTEAAFSTSASPDIGTIYQPDGVTEYSANQAKDIDAGKDFNHAIRLGDLMVDSDGYFTFRLDINEPGGSKSNILLDELQIFVADTSTLNQYVLDEPGNQQSGAPVSGSLLGATKIWDMDFNKSSNNGIELDGTTGENANERLGGINLDSVLSSGPSNGSGDFDMEFLLHSSLFDGLSEDSYVYLYNFMGETDTKGPNNNEEAGAGFEEWAVDVKTTPDEEPPGGGGGGIPEPSTAFLMAAGIAGLFRSRLKAEKSA